MSIATQLRMDDDTYKKIKVIAEAQKRSMNQQILFALNNFIFDYEKVNGAIEIKDEPEPSTVDFRTKNHIKK